MGLYKTKRMRLAMSRDTEPNLAHCDSGYDRQDNFFKSLANIFRYATRNKMKGLEEVSYIIGIKIHRDRSQRSLGISRKGLHST